MSDSKRPGAAYRLATWLLPPHRKQWAEAMLNEAAYVKSRGAAFQWALGCALTAVRERVAYELERIFMIRKFAKYCSGLVAVLVVGVVESTSMQSLTNAFESGLPCEKRCISIKAEISDLGNGATELEPSDNRVQRAHEP